MEKKNLLQPLQHKTLANTVMDELKQMILDGRIGPGDQLPSQGELADGFQVGLSTVREAIRGLALIGIVEPHPGRGTTITPNALVALRMMELLHGQWDELDPQKIYETRRAIEVEMTGLAAERASTQDLARIEDALEKMRHTIDVDQEFARADLEFHVSVAQAAKNRLMADYYFIAHEMLVRAIEQASRAPGAKETSLEIQAKILEAIRAGDSDGARRLANENLGIWNTVVPLDSGNPDAPAQLNSFDAEA